MKQGLLIFLQVAIVLLGIGALTFLLWEPHLEGRNVGATLEQIYFHDPFLAYVYVGSIPFFVALYKAFKIVEQVQQRKVFSAEVKTAVRTIKYCALLLIGFVAVGEVFILLQQSDDRAGAVFMGALIALGSLLVAAGATKGEYILKEVKV